MADGVQITVDNTRALAKLGRVPPAVRDNLRRVLPDLTKQLGALVNSKIASELQSHRTLTVKQELHESTKQIYGVVRLESPSAGGLLPLYLEKGTSPHEIVGNPLLAFYWPKVGANVFFHSVQHPGTKPHLFMERSFAEMKDEIVEKLRAAMKLAAAGAG